MHCRLSVNTIMPIIIYILYYSFGRLPRAIRLRGQRPEVIPRAIVRYWISTRFNRLPRTGRPFTLFVRVSPETLPYTIQYRRLVYLYYYTYMYVRAGKWCAVLQRRTRSIYFPAGRDANSDGRRAPATNCRSSRALRCPRTPRRRISSFATKLCVARPVRMVTLSR